MELLGAMIATVALYRAGESPRPLAPLAPLARRVPGNGARENKGDDHAA